jgi:predicted ABC-type ATPase
MNKPLVVILAGPNVAGKSNAAARLIPEWMAFVNADEVAKTLATYPSRAAGLDAGLLVLEQMDRLAYGRSNVAIGTTLAGRSLAQRLARLHETDDRLRLLYLFLPGADLAIARMAGRVRMGGRNIPEESIRRRYRAGLTNSFSLYQRLADRCPSDSVSAATRNECARILLNAAIMSVLAFKQRLLSVSTEPMKHADRHTSTWPGAEPPNGTCGPSGHVCIPRRSGFTRRVASQTAHRRDLTQGD